ncbi:hypothetical protein [Enterobacter phage 02_vB_Eclo_IJM]|nr:hypothetical protein [Enterobacter phage 02_vB_Eclo_IJM]
MKKDAQLALLTCVVVALYVSYPILSSHLSEISKVILLNVVQLRLLKCRFTGDTGGWKPRVQQDDRVARTACIVWRRRRRR